MAAEKEALQVWRKRIRDILNREWDPIGLCRDDDDEYGRYARTITTMIRNERDDSALMQYLERTERHDIGLGRFDAAGARGVIASIRKLGPPPV